MKGYPIKYPRSDEEDKPVTLSLNLPYAGDKGEKLVLKMQRYISKVVNKNKNSVSVNTIYKARRLGASFNIKDKIKFEHQHNVVYHSECPKGACPFIATQYSLQMANSFAIFFCAWRMS